VSFIWCNAPADTALEDVFSRDFIVLVKSFK
jgi:hypothetical protein